MQQEQFKEEILPLRGQLLSAARRILDDPDEAEDIVQETFLKLWHMRESLDEVVNIRALSIRMTRNACLNRIKARKKIVKNVDSDSSSETDNPHRLLENHDSLDRTIRIIDTLPELQRAVLRMKHFDGLEVAEIAELTGSNPEAVRMNLSRARRKVKEIFMKTEK